jgi:hypothetical protein
VVFCSDEVNHGFAGMPRKGFPKVQPVVNACIKGSGEFGESIKASSTALVLGGIDCDLLDRVPTGGFIAAGRTGSVEIGEESFHE